MAKRYRARAAALLKALVTGGLGFVGRWLVTALDLAGHEVTILDSGLGTHMRAPVIRDDLLTSDRLLSILDGFDIVFHFAAIANPHASKTDDFEQNIVATARLLKSMRAVGVKRIVFASSSSVYGDTTTFPTPEDAPLPIQTSLYGASKLAAEGLISAYARSFGMQATIFRFAPMMGEGYRRGHVRDFWEKLHKNPECIEVLGDGQQRRSYVYVQDATAAVLTGIGLELFTSGVSIYNVSGDETPTVDESLTWICDELGVNPRRIYTGVSWQGDKALTYLDTARMRALGWKPIVSIEEAVRRTVRSWDE